MLAYQEYYTVKDFQRWEGDWELIEGMPYAMSPSPSVTHQTVGVNLVTLIKNQLTHNKNCGKCLVLMETDWQIANDTVVRPDFMLICQDIGEKVMVTPELIVEIVSPSNTKRDEQMKFKLYQQEGLPYYILAYPEQRLARIYKNTENGFQKIADCSDYANKDVFSFSIKECELAFDFKQVWR